MLLVWEYKACIFVFGGIRRNGEDYEIFGFVF